jgi:hypothetical protein
VAVKRKAGKVDEEALDLPGVPDGTIIEDMPAMKVEVVKGCIESIARAASEDPEGLLETATEAARADSVSSRFKAECAEGEIDVMRRERILPDEKALEKISRYETHLTRRLYHALHELQALQTRRLGGNAPLARLDVQGLPES